MSSGKEFEEYVKSIYSILLNLKDEGIVVSGGATTFLKGITGAKYQIDVYYEFERAGVRHRVIIECKDWKSPVKREQISVLESKVRDIPGVIGVFISKAGYQSGAINFANKKGILALTIEELPSLEIVEAEEKEMRSHYKFKLCSITFNAVFRFAWVHKSGVASLGIYLPSFK